MIKPLWYLLLLGVSYASILTIYAPLSLYFGPFRVASSQTNIAMENSYEIGQFLTASMYDDAVIFADGTEKKVIFGNDFATDNTLVSDIIQDIWYFMFGSVRTPTVSQDDLSAYYVGSIDGNTLTITRSIKMADQNVVGIRRTLVIPSSSRIILNERTEVREFPVSENKRFITDGIEQIVIFLPESPLALRMALDSRTAVAFFSSEYGIVISMTAFFDSEVKSYSGWQHDKQRIELVRYEYQNFD